ncbi:MAG TPA: TetR/AcrR family transcriptional regulator, partial [Clostridiaceae bacterium]|nr:TetR/AcrR family transcriptional regulator [Clostridiaceae bacterium]
MNIDKRTRKTREILSKTLVHLLLEKPLSEITVTELTEASDLNRATFYLHYANIYDLFQSIEDELVEQVQSWINTAYPKDSNVFHLEYDKDGTPTLPVIAEVFNFIYSNRETTAVLLRNPESKLLDRIYSQGRDTILKFLLSQENSSDKIRIEFSLD